MIKQAGLVLVIRLGGVALLFLSNLYVANLIGVQDYGYSNFILSVAMLGAMLTIGGGNRVITKYVARLSGADNLGRMRYYFQAIRVSLGALTVVFVCIYLVFQVAGRTHLDLWLAGGLTLLVSHKQINEGYLIGISRPVYVAFFESIVRPLGMVAILYVIGSHYSVTGVTYLYVICFVLFFIIIAQLFIIKPVFNEGSLLPVHSLKGWLAEANPFFLSVMAITVQNQMGVFILGLFENDVETGLYAVATRVSTALSFALIAVNMVYMPTYSLAYDKKDMAAINHHVRMISLLTAVFSFVVFFLILIFGAWVLGLFGAEFVAAAPALRILAFAMLVAALCGPVALLLSMTNYAVESSRVMLKSAALNIAFNLLLVPAFGMEGAACATLISVLYWNLVLLGKVYGYLGVRSGCIGMMYYKKDGI